MERFQKGKRFRGSGFRVQGSGFRVQGSGFRVQGSGFRVVVAASLQYIWGDARRFLGKQVSRLSVSAMILLTANDKDFSLRSK